MIQPGLRQGKADKLAEHLADLGGGGEITRRAERFAGGVIAVDRVQKTLGHVLGHRDRPAIADAFNQQRSQRRHLAPDHRARARSTNQSPAAIIGTDRICPIVSP